VDLSPYKDINPDEIYHNSDYKITFFYLPEKDEIIYSKAGYESHEDMLQIADSGSDKIFDAIFPGVPNNKKSTLRSRGQVLAHTNRIVGRFGALHHDMIVSLWNPLTDPAIPAFEKKLLETFPKLKKVDIIIVGADNQPRVMNVGTADNSKKKVEDEKEEVKEEMPVKRFSIDGQNYTFEELRQYRLLVHNAAGRSKDIARAILCHPDMKKYPEVNSLIPGTCPPSRTAEPVVASLPTKRKPRLRDYGLVGYGESFQEFYYRRLNELQNG